MLQAIHETVQTLDRDLVTKAVDAANSSSAAHALTFVAAEVLLYVLVAVLIVLWTKPEVRSHKHGGKKAALLGIMSVVAALAVKSLVSVAYFRDRPFVAHPDLHALSLRLGDSSFPSAHALVSFAFAYSLVLSGYKRLGWSCMAIALVIACGRVAAGVHYPTDVLAGALIGMACALYFHREASSLKRYLPNS